MIFFKLNRKLIIIYTIIVIICIIILPLFICLHRNEQQIDYKEKYEKLLEEQPPQIEHIRFQTIDGKVLNEVASWIILKNRVKILITFSGNCTEVELYIVPTGTETYKLQQLIDVIVPKNNIAEYIWDVPDSTMGYFWVVAYNKDVGRKTEQIKVIHEN